jgi:hypothetical protein
MIFILSLLFQDQLGRSPLQTGLALVPIMLAITASNLGAGRLMARFGPAKVIAAGALLLSLSCGGLLGTGAHNELRGDRDPARWDRLRGRLDRARRDLGDARKRGALALRSRRRHAQHAPADWQFDRRRVLFGSLVAGGFTAGLRAVLLICIAVSVTLGALTLAMEPGPRSRRARPPLRSALPPARERAG